MPTKCNPRNKKKKKVSSEVVKGEDRPVTRLYREYFDKDMNRIGDVDQATWIKITICDPLGVPVESRVLKVH
jgi:hypothetical protein